ncbi:monothiol glutaredoxin-S5-like [Lolium rigidum]|uniref:monothiol glutaredoxin-S5-like n=1 Tax=Lolium rigidum TaxID=89674 RepID=UPI001F5D2769|nr:monothiol glutaredoxin-S5-like [Lolium rigidum]
MYQAIPYSGGVRPWLRPAETTAAAVATVKTEMAEAAPASREEQQEVERAVSESPVVVVGRRACCLSHVVKQLLQGLGVNPAVHEVADEASLAGLAGGGVEAAALPAVFVGGKLLGGLDRLMAVHISGELVPILKKAGALWL